jgi:hypothetical protein
MEAFGPEVVAFVQNNPELTLVFTLALVIRRLIPYVERAIGRLATFYSVVLDNAEKVAERTVVFIEKMRRLSKRAWAESKLVTKPRVLPGPVVVPDQGKDAA